MTASTSRGAGTTIVPLPQRLIILPITRPILGSPLLSASFSCQDFFFAIDLLRRQALKFDLKTSSCKSLEHVTSLMLKMQRSRSQHHPLLNPPK